MRYLMCLFLMASMSAYSADKVVYENPVNKGAKLGKEWTLKAAADCKPEILATPKGGRHILAQIPQGQQKLELKNLPKHKYVRVQFEMIQYGTWDGIHPNWGPDRWKFGIDGRAPVVDSTFCNGVATLTQSFPDFHGDGYAANKAWHGAAETKTLGYLWNAGNRMIPCNAVYKFDFILPHSKASIALEFESVFTDDNGPDPDSTQWYGLDNIKVTVLEKHEQLSEAEVRKNFELLRCDKTMDRYKARLALIASAESTVAVIADSLVIKKNTKVAGYIRDLNSDDFPTREKASQRLKELNANEIQLLISALIKANEPEVIARLKVAIASVNSGKKLPLANEYVRLLKIIDSPEARKLLKSGRWKNLERVK